MPMHSGFDTKTSLLWSLKQIIPDDGCLQGITFKESKVIFTFPFCLLHNWNIKFLIHFIFDFSDITFRLLLAQQEDEQF